MTVICVLTPKGDSMKRTSSIALKMASVALTAFALAACAGTGVRETATDGTDKAERANQNQNNGRRGGFTKTDDLTGFYYSWQENPISAESRESLRRAGVSEAQLEAACKHKAQRDRGYAWKNGRCVFVREDFAVIQNVPQGLKLTINNSSDCRMEFMLSRTARKALRSMMGTQPGGRCQVAVEKTGERLSVKPLTGSQACSCPTKTGVFPIVVGAVKADLKNRFTGEVVSSEFH